MQRILMALFLLFTTLVLAQAVQKTYRLLINGKAVSGQAVLVGGKTYVSLEALKAAGVQASLSGTTLSLTLPSTPVAQGGSNQNAAVEGCLNEWLFNGLWRFRVLKVEPRNTEPRGWQATVELRNGSKADGIALAGTGWGGMQLILNDGNPVGAVSDAVDLRDMALLQGAQKTVTLDFYSDETSKTPSKLFLLLDPKGLTGTTLRYSVKDPSFRVRLDCRK
ncbi:MAG: hypothetical protein K6T57_10295 [Thermaceae bacterium]|nr:hypothetical protein [Thermaceae bacterium]